MADQQEQLTPEQIKWFDTPVSVTVPPDNQKWLDAMMEMKPEELQNYAVFQYQVPEAAARASGRDDLMQLIVTAASAQQGGKSVIRQKYRYIPGLKDIVDPVITSRRGRFLYLTRGEGAGMQVYDKVKDNWTPVANLTDNPRPLSEEDQRKQELQADSSANMANEFSPAAKRAAKAAGSAAPKTGSTPPEGADTDSGTPSGSTFIGGPAILAALPNMTRAQIAEVANELNIPDPMDEDKFPNKQSLVDAVSGAIQAQM